LVLKLLIIGQVAEIKACCCAWSPTLKVRQRTLNPGFRRFDPKGEQQIMNSHAPDQPTISATTSDRQLLINNLAFVKGQMARACQRSGRHAREVTLLPVTKTVGESRLRMAYEAGLRTFGENRVQEVRTKASAMTDLDIKWSIIGHLQTNKVKYVARFATEFQALDSLKLASALDRRLQAEGRSLNVLIQVNSSGEESKYGIPPADILPFVRQLVPFASLKVQGLMTLATFSGDEQRVRPCFRLMRRLRDRLRQEAPDSLSFDTLSMGMSGDFPIAIEEGATVVRIGQALFGQRPLPDSHYWPQSP